MVGFCPEESFTIPLGKGRYLKHGSDVTLIGMSYTSVVCKQAAETLAEEGIEAEVVDMLSLSPFDEEIIIESVMKTNRVVIVDEDTPRASMASEFAAVIAEKAFDYLDAPIKASHRPTHARSLQQRPGDCLHAATGRRCRNCEGDARDLVCFGMDAFCAIDHRCRPLRTPHRVVLAR